MMIKNVSLRVGPILFLVESALSGASCPDSHLSALFLQACLAHTAFVSSISVSWSLFLQGNLCCHLASTWLIYIYIYIEKIYIIEKFYALSTKSSDIQTVYTVRNHIADMIIENIRGRDPHELSTTVLGRSKQAVLVGLTIISNN